MKTPFQPTVVIPDVHGRPEISEAIRRHYDDGVSFVSTGDRVDGPDTFGVLEKERAMGVRQVLGNREWSLFAMMDDIDPTNRAEWAAYREARGYETDLVLKSYDVDLDLPLEAAMKALKDRMIDAQHYQYMRQASIFFKKQGANDVEYVVTHAGLTPTMWTQQAIQMALRNQDRLHREYGGVAVRPPQVFGQRVMGPSDIARQAKRQQKYPRIVRGHFHKTTAANAVQAKGVLITLATDIKSDPKAPVRVFEDWTNNVVEIEVA